MLLFRAQLLNVGTRIGQGCLLCMMAIYALPHLSVKLRTTLRMKVFPKIVPGTILGKGASTACIDRPGKFAKSVFSFGTHPCIGCAEARLGCTPQCLQLRCDRVFTVSQLLKHVLALIDSTAW